MRRRPTDGPVPPNPPAGTRFPGSKPLQPAATDQTDIVQPFIVSGGYTRFIDGFDPHVGRANGIQLVCSVYVPAGRVGFIKQIRVGPLMPTVLSDPWQTSGVPFLFPEGGDFPDDREPGATWRTAYSLDASGFTAADTDLLVAYAEPWRTPFGWEAFSPSSGEGPFESTNTWTWQLSFVKGRIEQIRTNNNVPPFSSVVPASYYLYPNVPADFTLCYPGGIPGGLTGISLSPQRMQCLPEAPLQTHIVIPEDMTACLFTRWTQAQIFATYGSSFDRDESKYSPDPGPDNSYPIFPIGPSYGQLQGYVQPNRSPGSVENAVYGWGG